MRFKISIVLLSYMLLVMLDVFASPSPVFNKDTFTHKLYSEETLPADLINRVAVQYKIEMPYEIEVDLSRLHPNWIQSFLCTYNQYPYPNRWAFHVKLKEPAIPVRKLRYSLIDPTIFDGQYLYWYCMGVDSKGAFYEVLYRIKLLREEEKREAGLELNAHIEL